MPICSAFILEQVLGLDMNALIQYKDHMQSLQDYSTYRNAKLYMFAPSPNATPLHGHMDTPSMTSQKGGLPPDDMEDLLPPAAMDTDAPFETLPAVETEALPTTTGTEEA